MNIEQYTPPHDNSPSREEWDQSTEALAAHDLVRASTGFGWFCGGWWIAAAHEQIKKGFFRIIRGRGDTDPYLLRIWLSQPKRQADWQWDSQNSTLLHYFVRADDDECLHDHPCDFSTTILSGSYMEHLPPETWNLYQQEWLRDRIAKDQAEPRGHRPLAPTEQLLGPPYFERVRARDPGDLIRHRAADLHCVGSVSPGTWTLVHMGPKVREWGFHPEGRPWQPWRQYLGIAEGDTQ